MNLLDFFAKPIQSVKEALDLDPPSLTDQLVQIKNQLTEVQERLDESRAIEREKDSLILQLKDAMKVKGDMVLEGSAYFIKQKNKIVDGPFCTCCADRDQQSIHLVQAPKPKGQPGRQMDWVQCPQCQTPFRSKQAGDYLKARKLPSTGSQAGKSQTGAKAKSSVTSKPSTQAGTKPSSKKTAPKPKRSAQTRTTKRAATSKTKSRRASR